VSTHISNIPIANRSKLINPIGNSQLVDMLLRDYAELIDPNYTKWFAKRFYTLPFDAIHRAASEARADGDDPRRLFAHLIKKLSYTQESIT
jgi:hypothetical protein